MKYEVCNLIVCPFVRKWRKELNLDISAYICKETDQVATNSHSNQIKGSTRGNYKVEEIREEKEVIWKENKDEREK